MKVTVKKVKKHVIRNSDDIKSTDTTCGLIGPLDFKSFFDEDNNFAINEIGTFIFSGGFDSFVFIEKTLKCMWHFQSVADNKIILENELGDTYVCHDWETFCTTVLPGVHVMYNLTDKNSNSKFELKTNNDDHENNNTVSFKDGNSQIVKPVRFSINDDYISEGHIFLISKFQRDKSRMFFISYNEVEGMLTFLVPSNIVGLDGRPINMDTTDGDICETHCGQIGLSGIRIYFSSGMPISGAFSMNASLEYLNIFERAFSGYIYPPFNTYSPEDMSLFENLFSDNCHRNIKSSLFLKREVGDNGVVYISVYYVTGVNGATGDVSINFNEYTIIRINSDGTAMVDSVPHQKIVHEKDFNEFIKDKSFFIF